MWEGRLIRPNRLESRFPASEQVHVKVEDDLVATPFDIEDELIS